MLIDANRWGMIILNYLKSPLICTSIWLAQWYNFFFLWDFLNSIRHSRKSYNTKTVTDIASRSETNHIESASHLETMLWKKISCHFRSVILSWAFPNIIEPQNFLFKSTRQSSQLTSLLSWDSRVNCLPQFIHIFIALISFLIPFKTSCYSYRRYRYYGCRCSHRNCPPFCLLYYIETRFLKQWHYQQHLYRQYYTDHQHQWRRVHILYHTTKESGWSYIMNPKTGNG